MRKESFGQYKETLLDAVIKKLRFFRIKKNIQADCFVVDLGCGFNGELLNSFSSHINKGIGIDLRVSKKMCAPNITLMEGKVDKKLSLPNECADIVIAIAIIEHLDNPDMFLSETKRIIKPGGVLLLTTPSKKAKPLLEFLAFKLKLISQEEITDHKRYYNGNELKETLIKAGFSPSKISVKGFQFGFNLFLKATK